MEADHTIDAAGKLVIPGGIDPHTHMELPFGGTESSDDFRTGTIAAAHGGTTSIIDFAVQYKGQSLIEGIDNWHKKAEGKTAIDYGFHLITTELEDSQIEELYTAMDEGVTSFKMFMAYPGVFLVDDATIFRAMSAAGERGGLICMHAENGIVINEIIKRALERPDRAEVSRIDTTDDRRSRRRASRDRDRRDGGVARVHRSPLLCRRAQPGAPGARSRHPGVRRNVPAVSLSLDRQLRRTRIRRREVCDDAAACVRSRTRLSCGRV
jgi:dihydroorotase-like cyclic amidohydrolase